MVNVICIRDYAKSKGVSYEAVRKQVNRYKQELEGHIIVNNRTQYLDDEAVAFLDQKRAESPIIIMESAKDEELERLKAENELLKNQLLASQQDNIKVHKELLEATKLIAEAEVQKKLLADAEQELAKYKKSWFGLYKKVE